MQGEGDEAPRDKKRRMIEREMRDEVDFEGGDEFAI